jgi:hypothetical protein
MSSRGVDMKTFKWTVPSAEHADPRSMDRSEYTRWLRVRARGFEWFVVQKGLLFLVTVPALSALTGGPGFRYEIAVLSWFSGLCAGTVVWYRHEMRFDRARDAGMRVPGDDPTD